MLLIGSREYWALGFDELRTGLMSVTFDDVIEPLYIQYL